MSGETPEPQAKSTASPAQRTKGGGSGKPRRHGSNVGRRHTRSGTKKRRSKAPSSSAATEAPATASADSPSTSAKGKRRKGKAERRREPKKAPEKDVTKHVVKEKAQQRSKIDDAMNSWLAPSASDSPKVAVAAEIKQHGINSAVSDWLGGDDDAPAGNVKSPRRGKAKGASPRQQTLVNRPRNPSPQMSHVMDQSNQGLSVFPPPSTYRGRLSRIRVLYLSNNRLKRVPATIGDFHRLTGLGMKENLICDIAPQVAMLTNLVLLDMRSNRLTGLPAEIGQLCALRKLFLRYNQLSSLPEQLGQLSQLELLSVRNNVLLSLPSSLSRLRALEVLDADHNQLIAMPNVSALTSLKQLNFAHNRITEVSPVSLANPNLTRLLLGGNQIASFSLMAKRLPHLEELDLEDNRLEQWPNGLADLPALNKLYLSANQLSEVPSDMGRQTVLQSLFMRNNRLARLPAEICGMKGLRELDLTGNPLCTSSALLNPDIKSFLDGVDSVRIGPGAAQRNLAAADKDAATAVAATDVSSGGGGGEGEGEGDDASHDDDDDDDDDDGSDTVPKGTPVAAAAVADDDSDDNAAGTLDHTSIIGFFADPNADSKPATGKPAPSHESGPASASSSEEAPAAAAGKQEASEETSSESESSESELGLSLGLGLGLDAGDLSGLDPDALLANLAAVQPSSSDEDDDSDDEAPTLVLPDESLEMDPKARFLNTRAPEGQAVAAYHCIEEMNLAGLRRGKKAAVVWGGGRKKKTKKYQQEDAAYVEVPHAGKEGEALFCVFDGHAGMECSLGAVQHFPPIFKKHLEAAKNPLDLQEVFHLSYLETDSELRHCEYQGSTATTAYVWTVKGQRYLQVANVGDSTAFLLRNGKAVKLSEDHSLSKESSEKDRLARDGHPVTEGQTRLNGLSVTRALGDHFAKDADVGLIAVPFTCEPIALTDTDSMLIVASDGLWDVIDGQTAFDMARTETEVVAMTRLLIKTACDSHACSDNVTVIVALL